LNEAKRLVCAHLEQRHAVFVRPDELKQTIIPSTQEPSPGGRISDFYVHTKTEGLPRSLLAFENIGFDTLRPDEQEILQLVLDLALGALEKKLFFQISQELSIIDGVTEGYSLSFFMENLRREMENAARNGYALTVITLSVINFESLTKDMNTKAVNDLIRLMQNAIMKLLRKSDMVARWDVASFAFLLTHTPLERATIARDRIKKVIVNDLAGRLPDNQALPVEMGIRQYEPQEDTSPEAFFANAQPGAEPEVIDNSMPKIV